VPPPRDLRSRPCRSFFRVAQSMPPLPKSHLIHVIYPLQPALYFTEEGAGAVWANAVLPQVPSPIDPLLLPQIQSLFRLERCNTLSTVLCFLYGFQRTGSTAFFVYNPLRKPAQCLTRPFVLNLPPSLKSTLTCGM